VEEGWQVVGRSKVPEYIDTVDLEGAQKGKFEYRVRAKNRVGEAPWSNAVGVLVERQGTLRGAGPEGSLRDGYDGRGGHQLPTIVRGTEPVTITSGTMTISQSHIDVTKLKLGRRKKVKRS